MYMYMNMLLRLTAQSHVHDMRPLTVPSKVSPHVCGHTGRVPPDEFINLPLTYDEAVVVAACIHMAIMACEVGGATRDQLPVQWSLLTYFTEAIDSHRRSHAGD